MSAVVEKSAPACTATEPLFCDKGHCIFLFSVHALGRFLEEFPLLNMKLTAQILVLFIWLLISTIQSFSPSICTGSLIITLFTLHIIITAYLELPPWTMQGVEDTENSQADIAELQEHSPQLT